MIPARLLIADNNRDDLNLLSGILNGEVEEVILLTDPGRINETMRRTRVDIVLLEVNFRDKQKSGNEGFFWMKEILKADPDISIILVASAVDADLSVRAMKEGAFDFLKKPWNGPVLLAAINGAWKLRSSLLEASRLKIDNMELKREINMTSGRLITGASPTMINVLNIVRKVASTDANVLLTGENGTGKELVAREIHKLSRRSGELMISVDMGSITESLFESELFGHVKGAFTDAREERKGKFEAAHGSTLFLDEIGNLSLRSQSKLLNVLQSRRIVKVGSNKPVPVDIRLICATNCNLLKMVSEGSFREDLFYRINTIMIEVPPLRDRVDDIPILAGYFLRINSEKYDKPDLKISNGAMEKLIAQALAQKERLAVINRKPLWNKWLMNAEDRT